MKRSLLITAAAVMATLGTACSSASTPGSPYPAFQFDREAQTSGWRHSGIRGFISLDPECTQASPACGRPSYSGWGLITISRTTGEEVAHANSVAKADSAAETGFSIALSPGLYEISVSHVSPLAYGTPQCPSPARFHAPVGAYIDVQVHCLIP